MERRWEIWVAAALVAAMLASPALAQEAEPAADALADVTDTVEAPAKEKAPWRGSLLSLRTEATLLSLDRGAELTYNPYVALSFEVRPRWHFGDVFYVLADFSLTRELTDSDVTTKQGETWVGDLAVGGGAERFVTIPGAGIDLSADLRVIAPTSKLSQARTVLLGLRGDFTLSRRFELLEGLTIAYTLQGTGWFHRNTTAETEAPLIGGCSDLDGSCDRFLNTGLRNAWFRLGNSATISMDFLAWLGLDVTAAYRLDFLYAAADSDPRISFVPAEPTDRRHSLAYEIGLRLTPMPSLRIGVGISGLNPLQAPDSSAYKPFVNRYTMGFVELTLLVDGLVSQIQGEDNP
jgi:hypothetical protein